MLTDAETATIWLARRKVFMVDTPNKPAKCEQARKTVGDTRVCHKGVGRSQEDDVACC